MILLYEIRVAIEAATMLALTNLLEISNNVFSRIKIDVALSENYAPNRTRDPRIKKFSVRK